jgi:hypothetical protein
MSSPKFIALVYGVVALNEPFPVAINNRPYGLLTESMTSAAIPAPAIHIPAPTPFGVEQKALSCCSVAAL